MYQQSKAKTSQILPISSGILAAVLTSSLAFCNSKDSDNSENRLDQSLGTTSSTHKSADTSEADSELAPSRRLQTIESGTIDLTEEAIVLPPVEPQVEIGLGDQLIAEQLGKHIAVPTLLEFAEEIAKARIDNPCVVYFAPHGSNKALAAMVAYVDYGAGPPQPPQEPGPDASSYHLEMYDKAKSDYRAYLKQLGISEYHGRWEHVIPKGYLDPNTSQRYDVCVTSAWLDAHIDQNIIYTFNGYLAKLIIDAFPPRTPNSNNNNDAISGPVPAVLAHGVRTNFTQIFPEVRHSGRAVGVRHPGDYWIFYVPDDFKPDPSINIHDIHFSWPKPNDRGTG